MLITNLCVLFYFNMLPVCSFKNIFSMKNCCKTGVLCTQALPYVALLIVMLFFIFAVIGMQARRSQICNVLLCWFDDDADVGGMACKTGPGIFGPGMQVPKSHSSCCCCCYQFCCYQFSKNPQGFLNTQRSATKLCVHILADIPRRSTVSDFPLIF